MVSETKGLKNSAKKDGDKMQSHIFVLVSGLFAGAVIGFLLASLMLPGDVPQGPTPTGRFLISGGSTTSTGEQSTANPDDGAIKGTLVFTIQDPETGLTVSSEVGSNWTIYFSADTYSISNWSKVKDDTTEYLGNLSNVDADGNLSVCHTGNYSTYNYYYDTDGDDTFDEDEETVYKIVTDVLGCFSAKLPVGNYSIYA